MGRLSRWLPRARVRALPGESSSSLISTACPSRASHKNVSFSPRRRGGVLAPSRPRLAAPHWLRHPALDQTISGLTRYPPSRNRVTCPSSHRASASSVAGTCPGSASAHRGTPPTRALAPPDRTGVARPSGSSATRCAARVDPRRPRRPRGAPAPRKAPGGGCPGERADDGREHIGSTARLSPIDCGRSPPSNRLLCIEGGAHPAIRRAPGSEAAPCSARTPAPRSSTVPPGRAPSLTRPELWPYEPELSLARIEPSPIHIQPLLAKRLRDARASAPPDLSAGLKSGIPYTQPSNRFSPAPLLLNHAPRCPHPARPPRPLTVRTAGSTLRAQRGRYPAWS